MVCLLCGAEGVQMGLARYRDGTFAAIPRCRDAVMCQRRVEANGDSWDISDPLPPERPRGPRIERPRLSVIRGGHR